MKVDVGGERYVVSWSHTQGGFLPPHIKAISFCVVERVYPAGPGEKVVKEFVAAGEARCSVVDQFCKGTGRRVSMTHALRAFTRQMRSEVWKAYWDMKHCGGAMAVLEAVK